MSNEKKEIETAAAEHDAEKAISVALDTIGKRDMSHFMEQQRERMVEKMLFLSGITFVMFQQLSPDEKMEMARQTMRGFCCTALEVCIAYAVGMGLDEKQLTELTQKLIKKEIANPSVRVTKRQQVEA